MNRRTFLTGTTGLACLATIGSRAESAFAYATGTPVAEDAFPMLAIGLTDDGFELPDGIQADRYHVTVTNHGTSDASHSALGRIRIRSPMSSTRNGSIPCHGPTALTVRPMHSPGTTSSSWECPTRRKPARA